MKESEIKFNVLSDSPNRPPVSSGHFLLEITYHELNNSSLSVSYASTE
jgi:hypothetical protein